MWYNYNNHKQGNNVKHYCLILSIWLLIGFLTYAVQVAWNYRRDGKYMIKFTFKDHVKMCYLYAINGPITAIRLQYRLLQKV